MSTSVAFSLNKKNYFKLKTAVLQVISVADFNQHYLAQVKILVGIIKVVTQLS